ncbi:hypothetical protein COV82_05260 [Candidatus Peregrinibacteria bacterium CG11_big_fil_rev_8_21_14_0_20_46_8]|nr:MAG: hypothetical protein COV82_05260 [Candidatus Peregrinibacteria bacterium CG11_big_fil_rev_8_21_14_0_20_46_8]
MSKELFTQIEEMIDEQVRPLIQMDGGEIELVELTDEGILKVRLHGACNGCFASSMTLQYGVQQAIDEAFPDEDIQLELIDAAPPDHGPPERNIHTQAKEPHAHTSDCC